MRSSSLERFCRSTVKRGQEFSGKEGKSWVGCREVVNEAGVVGTKESR